MDAQDIINSLVAECGDDYVAMTAALQDGAALAALNIGDDDQDAVEGAYAWAQAAQKFGTVEHEGQTLALTQEAFCSNRPDDATYQARAEDPDGNGFMVFWDCLPGWEAVEDESECCDWSRYTIKTV